MSQDRLRILGLESYDAGSHRAVRESISRHGRHEWCWLTQPGRSWKWRMRTGAVELLEAARQGDALEPPPDVIFVTSLTSVADLRAMLPRGLRDLPIVLYMHENQVAYPVAEDAPTPAWDVHFALTNLTSILSADRTIWNSAWNRDSFVAGIESVLKHHPDPVLPNLAAALADDTVVWPPVEPPPPATQADPQENHPEAKAGVGRGAPKQWGGYVVWPHRAEHDKGPQALLALARSLAPKLELRWILLGQRYGRTPPALETFRREFARDIDHDGYETDRRRYWAHLERADWVLSTAHHEYFGIAVAEALLAGCLPWLPDRLSYVEILPSCARGLRPDRPPQDPGAVRTAVRAHLEPALAANAVRRIEDIVQEVVQSHRYADARA